MPSVQIILIFCKPKLRISLNVARLKNHLPIFLYTLCTLFLTPSFLKRLVNFFCTSKNHQLRDHMSWQIKLKFHSNSVHCLYWIAVKIDLDQSDRSWDILSQNLWFLRCRRNYFWNGGSIKILLFNLYLEVYLPQNEKWK